MDLHYVHRDNPGLVQRHLDAMLAESWQLARDDAIAKMAKLDSSGQNSLIWKADCQRWDRYLPADLPYTLEDILGRAPGSRGLDPRPDRWPPGVQRKLQEVFGPELDLPPRVRSTRAATRMPRNPRCRGAEAG